MQSDIILIDWHGEIFGQWCQRCNKVTVVIKYDKELRCQECGWKMGEKLDAEYVRHLRENGELQ